MRPDGPGKRRASNPGRSTARPAHDMKTRWRIRAKGVDMVVAKRGIVTRAAAATSAGAFLFLLATTFGARAADDKPYVMKITLATVNEVQHQFAKNYAAAIEQHSGGRIK